MSEPEILFEERGRLGMVTLNRPSALNALTHDMTRALDGKLREWAEKPGVAAVAIRGAGGRAFCAGGDIRHLYDLGKAGQYDVAVGFWREEYLLDALIRRYPKPYIAFIDGYVMGGGVGISVHGSHRVGVGKIGFAMPEVGIGFFPDVGATYFLPRMPNRTGLWIGLTGARLDAPDALRLGLLTHVLSADTAEHAIEALVEGASPERALAPEGPAPAAPIEQNLGAIADLFGHDRVEHILAALDREAEGGPAAAFAAEAAKSIRAKSPTSLKIAVEGYRRGGKLDFAEALRTEFRIASRIVRSPDFYEGVRATVIERGSPAQWSPAKLEDVSDAEVAQYFAPLGEKELEV